MTQMKINRMRLIFFCYVILHSLNAWVSADTFEIVIHSEQWDMPRHGETLIKQPELGKLVRLWASRPDSRIDIRYPGGEGGELWVQELMDWLVALGVPSEAIVYSLGSGGEDIIKLALNSKQVKGNQIDE